MEERIQKLIDEKLMTQNAFAESIGISSDTLYNFLHGTGKRHEKIVRGILTAYPEVNRDWLLTGRGEMYNSQEEVQIVKSNNEESKDFIIENLSKTIDSQQKTIEKLVDKLPHKVSKNVTLSLQIA